MMTPTANSHEASARLGKSVALFVRLVRAEITVELAQLMTVSDWQEVARAARVNPPSVETRAVVLTMMRNFETPLKGAK